MVHDKNRYGAWLAWLLWSFIAVACASPREAAEPRSTPAARAQPLAPAAVASDQAKPSDDDLGHGAATVPVTFADPHWGSPTAPVTIVEFSDFECPFCARVQATLAKIRDTYGPEKVRFVWKHNPLTFHKQAWPAHEASATVFALGGDRAFWHFQQLAFRNQTQLDEAHFEQWAVQAGVKRAAFRTAFASRRHAEDVEEGIRLAARVGALGTPAFRINGVEISGAQPFETFKEVIDAQLADADKLLASGVKPAQVYLLLTNRNQTKLYAPGERPGADEPAADTSVWKVPVYADDPKKGAKDALVTIVEFGEFQCPYCERVQETLERLLATYPSDVRVVWKDNPLAFHLRARPAALLARHAYAAKGEAGFWAAHDALFRSAPDLEDEHLESVAERIGLPWPAPAAALRDDRYGKKIAQSMDLAHDFQARGTPHFFINGVRLSGAQAYESFDKLVVEQLEKAKSIVASGVPRTKVYEAVIKDAKEPPPPERKEVPSPDATSPFRGNAKAKVVMQVWSDFQCPFCKRVAATLAELEKQHGNQLKIVWRHLPLSFHKDAALAAEAAQEVFAQKGNAAFWRYHDELFEAQGEENGLGRANLERLAAKLALNMDEFRSALDTGKHTAKVQADVKVASDAGIRATPEFVINGYSLSGAQPANAFSKIIRRAIADADSRKAKRP